MTLLWWFLPFIDMNHPQVYMCLPILNPTSTSHLSGCPRALVLSACSRHKSSWRKSSLAPLYSHWAGDSQTGEQLYQRNSHIAAKVLGPKTDFPTWGSGKGTEYPQGIWLLRSVGFDYRTSTGLEKQRLIEGTNKTLRAPEPKRKEQWSHKRPSQTSCVCLGVSGGGIGRQWPAAGSGALTTAVLGGLPSFWRRSQLPLP